MAPPPLRPPKGQANQPQRPGNDGAVRTEASGLVQQVRSLLMALLFERQYFFHLTGLLLFGELLLGLLIIRFIPYTKIDWEAYMQHVECFLNGERDYSQLEGETGGAVYPALFLYAYTALYKLLPSDPDLRVRAAQYIFLGIYLVTFALVAGIYHSAGASRQQTPEPRSSTDRGGLSRLPSTYPQALLIPLCLSKRLHSIYMLRLFNDPIAMLLLYAGVYALTRRTRLGWNVGIVLYSLALGVKMNILLFLPGLLVLLVQYQGLAKTAGAVSTMVIVQLLLPAAFFLGSVPDAQAYFSTAFNFSRQFVYKWTVNWRFVPESRFLSEGFAKSLLCGQLFFLVIFALFKWSPVPGGTKNIILNAISKPTQGAAAHTYALPRHHIPLVLFTSNLIGITFARSLHYQFHSWYFHQIPFLLYSGGAWGNPALGLALWLGIEYAWATYPSTNLSSGILSVAHAVIILGLLFSPASSSAVKPSITPDPDVSLKQSGLLDVDSRKVR